MALLLALMPAWRAERNAGLVETMLRLPTSSESIISPARLLLIPSALAETDIMLVPILSLFAAIDRLIVETICAS